MLKIEKTKVIGWEASIRGLRNPMNSWHLSDTRYDCNGFVLSTPVIGEKDLDLMKRLVKAGPEHAKFLRYLTVYADWTGPLYWWKEADTYRAGLEKNSTSTMHRIHAKPFEFKDFSVDHLQAPALMTMARLIDLLNEYRDAYVMTKNKDYWWQMIQMLPSSYNQKRTVMVNYATLRNMYHQRQNHKLDEWHTFCQWVETLPYSELMAE